MVISLLPKMIPVPITLHLDQVYTFSINVPLPSPFSSYSSTAFDCKGQITLRPNFNNLEDEIKTKRQAYMIQVGVKNVFSIGITSNAKIHCEQLQVGNHQTLRLIAQSCVTSELEMFLRDFLPSKATGLSWYRLTDEEVERVKLELWKARAQGIDVIIPGPEAEEEIQEPDPVISSSSSSSSQPEAPEVNEDNMFKQHYDSIVVAPKHELCQLFDLIPNFRARILHKLYDNYVTHIYIQLEAHIKRNYKPEHEIELRKDILCLPGDEVISWSQTLDRIVNLAHKSDYPAILAELVRANVLLDRPLLIKIIVEALGTTLGYLDIIEELKDQKLITVTPPVSIDHVKLIVNYYKRRAFTNAHSELVNVKTFYRSDLNKIVNIRQIKHNDVRSLIFIYSAYLKLSNVKLEPGSLKQILLAIIDKKNCDYSCTKKYHDIAKAFFSIIVSGPRYRYVIANNNDIFMSHACSNLRKAYDEVISGVKFFLPDVTDLYYDSD